MTMHTGNRNPMRESRGRRRRRQRGAAIITALFVVALAAILVSGLLWRQQVQIRRIENQRLLSQAQWIARGALEWTRLILRSEGDTAPGITYLGGVWGVPIARTRLSDFLGEIGDVRAEEGAATYLSGSIEDAQARFNLRNLVTVPRPGAVAVDPKQLLVFQRLLTSLGLDGQLAGAAAKAMRDSLASSATRFQTTAQNPAGLANPQSPTAAGSTVGDFSDKPGLEDSDDKQFERPIQMIDADSLLDVQGFTPEVVARLRPFVIVLPTTTVINMNTASAEVIAASVPGMSIGSAQALVSRRETVFFRNTGDVQLALQAAGVQQVQIDLNSLGVDTNYFLVHGNVQHERAELVRTTLIYRDSLTKTTRIVSVHDE
jgi:general secretion pathway protein K